MIRDLQLVAETAAAGVRLDRWLTLHCPSVARAQAEAAIAAGTVMVNGRRVVKGHKLVAGDAVRVAQCLEKRDLAVVPDAAVPLCIVFEDAHLLACDKPAGMPVHPLRAGETGTLANALLARHPELAGIGGDPLFPALVHRLDADTSGLVLAARTAEVYAALRHLFQTRQVHKEYLALVQGRVGQDERLEHELAHNPARPGQIVVVTARNRAKVRRPLRAVTECAVAERLGDHTLLRVVIKTGVTHQIRCQLAAIGHALVGDGLYGAAGAAALGLSRHFLHAARLEFAHPITGARLQLEAPLPAELAAVCARLRTRPL
jgi:23S rRNA pseudouridine1911/1915/1917 synthase